VHIGRRSACRKVEEQLQIRISNSSSCLQRVHSFISFNSCRAALKSDTFEPEPEVDLQVVQNEIRALEGQLSQTREKMNFYLKELGIDV
jgi:hypothetical protein